MAGSAYVPVLGAALTDAPVTKNPASDGVSEYQLPTATLSASRTLTLGTTGSPVTNDVVRIVRLDLTAHTYLISDGSSTLFTFPASPPGPTGASFYFNGTAWKFLSAYALDVPPNATTTVAGLMSAADKTSFSGMNVAGRQSVTTGTATPTVAMSSRADILTITIGVTVTKLVVTGLDLATDGGYDLDGTVLADGTHDVTCKLNDSDDTGRVRGLYVGGPTAFAPTTLQLVDSVQQNGQFLARLRDGPVGAGKIWQGNFVSNVPQWYIGSSTLTGNVTSFSLPNMLAGSVINIRRIRPTAL